jgi:hypothetical protein
MELIVIGTIAFFLATIVYVALNAGNITVK